MIFGPKKTRTGRPDKNKPEKMLRPSARLENGNPSYKYENKTKERNHTYVFRIVTNMSVFK